MQYVAQASPRPGHRRIGDALAAVALFAVTACGGGEEEPRATDLGLAPDGDSLRNVVVICLDCLRPDHLGAYGYDRRDASPWIDELASRSVVFDSAWAASSWTKTSVPSYLTGLQPAQHGVYVGVLVGSERQLSDGLGDPSYTIAEAFDEAGFDTACIASNAQISDEFGFSQGFRHFVNRRQSGREIADRAEAWLQNRDDRAPYFLYLHLVDTHWPYHVPDEYRTRYATPEQVSRIDLEGGAPWVLDVNKGKVELDQEQIDSWIAIYDGSLRYSDDVLRDLAPVIEEENGGRETVVCLISDHGESLFEYGDFGHGMDLGNETLRVPWILHVPGVEPARVPGHVSLTELPARLLESSGLNPDLMPRPERPDTGGAAFAELSQIGFYLQAWVRDEYKLVRTYRAPRPLRDRLGLGSGRMRAREIHGLLELGVVGAREAGWKVTDRLYDLASGEGEPLTDSASVKARLGRELESYGQSLLGHLQEAAETEIGEERMKELNALGYTGK